VAYFSRLITAHHAKLAVYKHELIGLVHVVRHWRPYLWGRSFLIKTDHYSLKFLLDQRLSIIPQHQWASKLLGFDFHVKFKPGVTNVVAGALSRRATEEAGAMALSCPSFHLLDSLRQEVDSTPDLRALLDATADDTKGPRWRAQDGLIIIHDRIYLPPSLSCLQQALTAAHGAGHEGIAKTLHRLHVDFHVSGSHAIVSEFVRACAMCQRNKAEHLHPAGLLQPLEVPLAVWADIAMDFMEGFPRINGKSMVLTVVGRFSKYAHFITLGHPYTATSVARAFFDNIVQLHGVPSSIVSDRDPSS
jgi:hypothetical protein